MTDLYETMLVQDGRVRLVERHLARLARSGASDFAINRVTAAIRSACLLPAHVLRLDVSDDNIVERPRAAKLATPARLITAIGYDPASPDRERKFVDRSWADPFEAARDARSDGDETLLISPVYTKNPTDPSLARR